MDGKHSIERRILVTLFSMQEKPAVLPAGSEEMHFGTNYGDIFAANASDGPPPKEFWRPEVKPGIPVVEFVVPVM